jgi:uncharacterized protein involved in exopolysaccharide biosynthesis
MQDFLNSESNDDINLRELFVTLWAYKLFIAGTCALGVIISGYYALNAKKVFTSTAIFKLNQDNNSGISLSPGMESIISLSKNSLLNNSILPTDQVSGRIFIEKLDTKLNFQADPYFNTYNPNAVDPIWKSLIKGAIGWHKPSSDTQEATWQGIIAVYSKNVVLDETKDGSVKIVARHSNPQRAAKIANVIMSTIISNAKDKKNAEQDKQLFYLSNTLAKALNDMELSQSRLKQFTLENSALPLESFNEGSLELDGLREQLSRTSELHEAVAALSLILRNKATDQKSYLALSLQFPIIDQVEFRRILGQNEIISSWSWPDARSVDTVFDTLTERISRLQSQIKTSQIDAARSSQALETYARLEREANISEATHTVLIEQVKAQSMIAGFQPDRTEIYEYAYPSMSPSAPNHSIILALGAVLGLLIGAVLSLVLALCRGVYYSKNSLLSGAQARLTASIRDLLPLRNKSLNDINKMLMKKPRAVLRDLAVEIHKSTATQVVVTSSRAKLTGNDVARALASYMQSDTMTVAVIDFSSRAKKQDIDCKRLSVGSFVVVESASHVSILRPNDDLAAVELLSQRNFWENTQSLNSTFDLVFLCADNGDGVSLLSAVEEQKTFHITLARTKKTKSANLVQMRSLLPIQGLLYD